MFAMPGLGQYLQTTGQEEAAAAADPNDIMSKIIKPPETEEEVNELYTGWKGFAKSLQEKPELAQAMILLGSSLMQGGNTAENFGKAGQQVIQLFNQAKQERLQQELLKRREDREDRQEARADRSLELQELSTEKQLAQGDRRLDLQEAQQKARNEIDWAQLKDRKAEAEKMYGLRVASLGLDRSRTDSALKLDELQRQVASQALETAKGVKIDGGGILGSLIEVSANANIAAGSDKKKAVDEAVKNLTNDPALMTLLQAGASGKQVDPVRAKLQIYSALSRSAVDALGKPTMTDEELLKRTNEVAEVILGASVGAAPSGAVPGANPSATSNAGDTYLGRKANTNLHYWRRPDGTIYTSEKGK